MHKRISTGGQQLTASSRNLWLTIDAVALGSLTEFHHSVELSIHMAFPAAATPTRLILHLTSQDVANLSPKEMLAPKQLLAFACEVILAQSQQIERLNSETHQLRQQTAFLMSALEHTLGQKQTLERQSHHRSHSEFQKGSAYVLPESSSQKLITWRKHQANSSGIQLPQKSAQQRKSYRDVVMLSLQKPVQQRKTYRDVLMLSLSSPSSWRRVCSSAIQPSFVQTNHHGNLQREAEVVAAAAATDSGDYQCHSQKTRTDLRRSSEMILSTSPQRPIECFAQPNPFASLDEGNVEERQADMAEKLDTIEQDVEEGKRSLNIQQCGHKVRPLAAFADLNPFSCLM